MKFDKISVVAVVAIVATVFLFAGHVLAAEKTSLGKFGAISMQQRIVLPPPKITCEYKDKCGIDWCFCMASDNFSMAKAYLCAEMLSICKIQESELDGDAGVDTIYGGGEVDDTKRSDGKRTIFSPPPPQKTCEERYKNECDIDNCECLKKAEDGLGRVSHANVLLCQAETLICLQDASKANSSFILLPLQKDENKPSDKQRTVFSPPPPQKTCEERYIDERDIKLCECLKAAEDGLGQIDSRAAMNCLLGDVR